MAKTHKTNLPPPATRFVGRVDELHRLQSLYDRGERLVTIFGPAGTGKTRLAQALGLQARERLALSGVWFCELSQARSLDEMCAVIERVLGIASRPANDATETIARLGRALAARGPVLLILDNFEQLASLAPNTVRVWLVEAPELRLLVTSREQLRVPGEIRFELLPLALPPEGSDEAAPCEAVELFIDRVRAIDPGFSIDKRNAELVATLVRRLEGIPLAIELAASRVELLGLQGLLDSLGQRLDVLVDSSRGGAGRHTTLRAAIDSSWSSLDDAERRCLAICSVFRGGFSVQAATQVVGSSAVAALGLVQSLRDKSLLRRVESEDRPGHARFSLFEAIRAFAAEKLEEIEFTEEATASHAAYFMAEGERLAASVVGADAVNALDALTEERDNLLAMQRWALSQIGCDSGEAAVRGALILDAVAAIRGPFASHLALLDETMAATQADGLPATLWIQALTARARASSLAGRAAAAHRDLDAALSAATDLGDERAQASVIVELAVRHHRQRETSTARVLYERALTLAREASDQHLEGRILGNLAALLHDRRKLDEALTRYRDALAVLQEVGDRRLEAIHVANLGLAEQERGEFARARGHYDAALELLGELGDQRLEAIVVGNLGTLEHEEDCLAEARACHERALAILRSAGDRHSEALCLGRLARVHAAGDYLQDANACAAAAERLLGRHQDALANEAIRIDRGFIDAALARQSTRAGDHDAAAKHAQAARDRIVHASTATDGEASWADLSDDIRAGTRLLEHDLVRSTTAAPPGATREAIAVGPNTEWVQVPGDDRHDLRRRKAIRLILTRLVAHQHKAPGAGLPLEALLEAGWPGERMGASAGANRVYVALTSLRKLGLRKYLLSQDDGYLLDPAMPTTRPPQSVAKPGA